MQHPKPGFLQQILKRKAEEEALSMIEGSNKI